MQVCTSLQTDNHTSTPPLSFLQAGCLSCHPTNSVKALKALINAAKFTKKTKKACGFLKIRDTISNCHQSGKPIIIYLCGTRKMAFLDFGEYFRISTRTAAPFWKLYQ